MTKIINYIQGTPKVQNKKNEFEINPLDINLAKMEMNLIKRCEMEVPENGDFASVVESFKSLDPTLDLSNIVAECKYDKNNSGIKNSNRILQVKISKKNQNDTVLILFKGAKKDLLEYLSSKEFFANCKAASVEKQQ